MGQLDDLAQAAAECRENWGLRPDGEFRHRYGLVEPVRVRAWSWAQAHLAAAWSIEDGEDPAHWLAVADRLEPLTGR